MHKRGTLSSHGQSLVEFALIAPLLLGLMFILIELGIVFSVYVGLTNSAREAARFGSLYQYDAAAPQLPGCAAHPTTGDPDIALVDCERRATMDAIVLDTRNRLIAITDACQLDPAGAADGCGADPSKHQRYSYHPASFPNSYRYGTKLSVNLVYRHGLFFNLLGPAEITIKAHSEMKLEPGGL